MNHPITVTLETAMASVVWNGGGKMSFLFVPMAPGQCRPDGLWWKWMDENPPFPHDLKYWVTESLQDGKFIPYQGLFDYPGKWL